MHKIKLFFYQHSSSLSLHSLYRTLNSANHTQCFSQKCLNFAASFTHTHSLSLSLSLSISIYLSIYLSIYHHILNSSRFTPKVKTILQKQKFFLSLSLSHSLVFVAEEAGKTSLERLVYPGSSLVVRGGEQLWPYTIYL